MTRPGPFTSITARVVTLVFISATFTALVVWLGTRQDVSPLYTLPFAITASVLVAYAVAVNIVEPLRQATKAAKAMARGDYSLRVHAPPGDEIGQLSDAFNSMARDLAEIDRMHRDIVANVSHELRTPLAALRSRLENMVDGVEPPSEESLTKALGQAERLTELLQFLLDLSRLEAGVVGLQLGTLQVDAVLADAVEIAALAAHQRGREVKFSRTVAPGLTVVADAGRLSQLLVNVLDNATKHAPAGTLVRVEAARARGQVRIDITDSGPGIDPAERERIFTRFQRGASSVADGGTGIGLAIARWAASIHGGTVSVADVPAGTCLRILLPAGGPEARGRP